MLAMLALPDSVGVVEITRVTEGLTVLFQYTHP